MSEVDVAKRQYGRPVPGSRFVRPAAKPNAGVNTKREGIPVVSNKFKSFHEVDSQSDVKDPAVPMKSKLDDSTKVVTEKQRQFALEQEKKAAVAADPDAPASDVSAFQPPSEQETPADGPSGMRSFMNLTHPDNMEGSEMVSEDDPLRSAVVEGPTEDSTSETDPLGE